MVDLLVFLNFSVTNCASLIFSEDMYEGTPFNIRAIFISACVLRHYFFRAIAKLYFRFSTLEEFKKTWSSLAELSGAQPGHRPPLPLGLCICMSEEPGPATYYFLRSCISGAG